MKPLTAMFVSIALGFLSAAIGKPDDTWFAAAIVCGALARMESDK